MKGGTEFDQVDLERTKQELQAARRELARALETHRADSMRRDSEMNSLRGANESLQASVDSLTVQRNKESRQRTDQSKQIEELRMENMKLRRDIAAALDTRSSHLRVPQVSFDQYRELVGVLEVYQALLSGGSYESSALAALGSGPTATPALNAAHVAAVTQARTRVERLESAPFAAGGSHQSPPPFSSHFTDPNVTAQDIGGSSRLGASPSSSPRHVPIDPRGRSPTQMASNAFVPAANVPTNNTTRENIVEGGKLVRITTELPHSSNPDGAPEKQWSIQNTTPDTQFIVEYTFGAMSSVEAAGDTIAEGRTFRLNLYPHETKPFVCGVINGYKVSVRYGPPDDRYVPSSSMTDADILPLVNRVRTVWRRSPAGTDVAEIASLCRAEGTPFLDVDFPPVSSALVRSFELMQDESPPVVYWLPPEKWLPKDVPVELCRSAVSPTALAASSGDGDNGWLVSGMAALAEDQNMVGQIFSPTLPSDEQLGLYSVWINKHGLWNIVSVDSFLPCKEIQPTASTSTANDRSRHRAEGKGAAAVAKYQLFGARAKAALQDIWPAILEKAFAKSHGSYYSLRHGDVLEALQDLTGFPVERFDWMRDRDTTTFSAIQKALNHTHSNGASQGAANIVMLATTTSAVSDSKFIRSIGLEPNGAFRVLAAVAVEQHRLILIRVSLKYEGHKWTGNWSADSDLWAQYPNTRNACHAASSNIDGCKESCIWMDWRDVARYFGGCGVCYYRPQWLDVRIGNRFHKNKPACMVRVNVSKQTRMFLGLHQKDRRGLPNTDADHLYGAFLLTIVAASATPGSWEILAQSHGGTFWRGRDAFLDVILPPNKEPYYIIPRRYSADGIKDTVLSMHVEHRDAVTMSLQETTEDILQSLRYTPLHKFHPPEDVMSRVDCQIDREPSTQLVW